MSSAKDILAALPDPPVEDYTLPGGAVLKMRGITSFEELLDLSATTQSRAALPGAPSLEAIQCVETFARGVVEPVFTYGEALEFSRKAAGAFSDVVRRINELSASGITQGITEARERIESDPPSAA